MTTKTTTHTKSTEKAEAVQWIRHCDTGAVRAVPAKDWKKDDQNLRAQGYRPCTEDGTPLEGDDK